MFNVVPLFVNFIRIRKWNGLDKSSSLKTTFLTSSSSKSRNKSRGKMNVKDQKSKAITTFDEHLDNRYGEIGTSKRTDFEIKAKAFAIGEVIREERRLASMTQEQLAEKTGTKKSFISRIENGHSDIQLSTLYKLLEYGLGRKITLTIE
jgi:ribosome-binding protein aMBF1 (putative translation factor)